MGHKLGLIYLIKVLAAGMVAVVLCFLFTCFYSFSGIHITNHSGAADYKWDSKQLKSTMTEGFAWLRMDTDGFNNAYPQKSEEVDILLMGSSHMDALNVDSKQNVGYGLNELIEDRYTYNIGMSGHTLIVLIASVLRSTNIFHRSMLLLKPAPLSLIL